MSIIFNTFAWYFPLLGIFAYMLIQQKKVYANEHTLVGQEFDYDISYDYRVSAGFAILVFLPLILAAGLREGIADTGLYIIMYRDYPTSLSELPAFLARGDRGPGFIAFSVLIRQLFGTDFHIWLFIIATIQGLCMAMAYRRYTSEIVFCAFIFFATGGFMAWMTNGIRQFLAAAILFAFFPLLQKRKFVFFLVYTGIWLLMITVHSSVVIVLPLYLVALGKPFNKLTILFLSLTVLAVIFMSQFTSLLGTALENTDYAGVADAMPTAQGQNPIRFLFSSMSAIVIILFRKRIPENVPPIIAVSINMSLITLCFDFFAMFTSGMLLGRLPLYFALFNYVLMPWEIKTFFPKGNRTVIYAILIILYLVFFLYQMYVWGWLR